MAEERKKEKENISKISRREFLKDAGLVIGGAAIGSMALANACKGTTTTETIGSTVTKTVTVTGAPGGTTPGVTTTITLPPVTSPVASVANPTLTINGSAYTLIVEPHWTLQYVLHDKLQLTGVKMMCSGEGQCGSCTVIMDGRPILSCMALALECVGHKIETIEGVALAKHALLSSFIKFDGMQCGYCTPGAIMTAKALLDKTPNPTADAIAEALSGNVCICGTYPAWSKAIADAAKGGK